MVRTTRYLPVTLYDIQVFFACQAEISVLALISPSLEQACSDVGETSLLKAAQDRFPLQARKIPSTLESRANGEDDTGGETLDWLRSNARERAHTHTRDQEPEGRVRLEGSAALTSLRVGEAQLASNPRDIFE